MGNLTMGIVGDEFLHGRINGRDFQLLRLFGTPILAFESVTAGQPPEILRPEETPGLTQTFNGVSLMIVRATRAALVCRIGEGPYLLLSDKYVNPATVKTPEEEAWLLLQEYWLDGDRSDAAKDRMLEDLRDLLGVIEKAHPEQAAELASVYRYADTGKIIAAIIEAHDLAEKIAAAPETPSQSGAQEPEANPA